MTLAWSCRDYVQIFHLLVSVMVLANLVGSWFGVNFVSGFRRLASVRGSLRHGDKALRHRGAIDCVKTGKQSVVEGKTPSLSFYGCVQIYRSISRKNESSVGDLATLALAAKGLLESFQEFGERRLVTFGLLHKIWRTELIHLP